MAPILAVILVLHTLLFTASAIPLPCTLRWKSIDAHTPVAQDWVSVNQRQKLDPTIATEYFVRIKSANSSNPVGRHTILSMQPMINQMKMEFLSTPVELENDEKIFRSYDILTNPYECKLSWESCQFSGQTFGIQKRAYYVKLSPEEETYVVRKPGESGSTRKHPGGSTVLAFVEKDSRDRNVRCLKSDKGGVANFTQFEFVEHEENEPSESMMGLDKVDNNSPATVMHRIDHRKKFSETFEFTETHSWEHLKTWSLDIGISAKVPLPTTPPVTVGIDLNLSWANRDVTSKTTTNTTSFRKEREVISSRSIMLGPYSSVQACSISSFQNKLKLNYRAKARHTAPPGTSVEDVKTIVKEAGYTILKTEGSSVIADMEGDLDGSLAMQTSLVVTELAGDLTCDNLPEKFRESDWLRSRIKKGDHNARAELKEVENDISRIKNGARVALN